MDRSRLKKILWKVFSYGVVVTIIFYLAKSLVSDWQSLKYVNYQFNVWYLLASGVLFLIVMLLQPVIWREVLKTLHGNVRLPLFPILKVYIYSQFGRYLPGSIWSYIGQVFLGEKEGIERDKLTVSVVYSLILSIAASFILPLLIFSFIPSWLSVKFKILTFVAAIFGIISLHPKLFYLMSNLTVRVFKIQSMAKESLLDFSSVLKFFLYNIAAAILSGVAFFVFVNAFIKAPIPVILYLVSSFILSAVLGMIAVFAPGGLGVREAFLVLFLRKHFTQSVSVFLSLGVRIWLTLIEVILFMVVVILDLRRKQSKALTDQKIHGRN